jgi:CubicO group peptidase (beta-lactamase class C family)
VDVTPGTLWRYAGGGYAVLQHLLQEATGTPFSVLAAREVLEPLGMHASTFQQPLPASWRLRAAVGHQANGSAVPGGWHVYPEQTAAGLWTTPTDLARFVVGVQAALRGGPDAVVPQTLARQMVTPVRANYALGLSLAATGSDSAYVTHAGVNEGYRAVLVGFVKRGQGAVIMTNGDAGLDLAYEVLRAVGREYGWPALRQRVRPLVTVAPDTLRALAGRYQLVMGRDTVVVGVRAAEGGMVADLPGSRHPVSFLPGPGERFFSTDTGVELAFIRDARGAVTALRVLGAGALPPAPRLP